MRKTMMVCALVMLTSVAWAQGTVVAVDHTWAESIRDIAVTLVAGVTTAFLGWMSYWVKQKFGVDIEAKHREAIAAFVSRQASGLIAAGAVKLEGIKIDVKSEALASAARMAMAAIPDALAYFGLTPGKIAEMIVDVIPKEPSISGAQAVAIDVKNPQTPTAAPVAGVKP
jgi:hypothetical protein